MIETLDDVIEKLADEVGVYGAHEDGETRTCRVCWTANLRERLIEVIKIEQQLYPSKFKEAR